MTSKAKPITILVADDDDEDQLLMREALAEARLAHDVRFVNNGEALLDYLRRRGKYAEAHAAPRPGLILLDLKMPRLDGFEALREIKADAGLRRIPVVVFTTSRAEEDVARTYDLGANAFIIKPVTFAGFVETVRVLGKYWFEIVVLPPGGQGD